VPVYTWIDIVPHFFFLKLGTVRVATVLRMVAIKNWKMSGEVLISFFWELTLEGKSMLLIKFYCCLDVYLKLYLRLKFLGFCNHFVP
jgi:hypothetical protein